MALKVRLRDIAAIVVLFLLLIALATARPRDPALYPAKGGDAVAIYMLDNGFHTDLVLPQGAVAASGGPLARAGALTGAAPWIMVGWGDAQFYEATSAWQDRILDGLRAALGGRRTIVHLEGVGARPDTLWKTGVHRIEVSRAGLSALIARADRSFVVDTGGAPIIDPAPHLAGEAFFRSGEGFSLPHDCNQWAAELLNAAGLPTTPVLDILPAGLWLDLELRAGL
jgi:uncharacterized protein (TIGR02117 family)